VLARLGGLDILVNNVGGCSAPSGGALALSHADWQQTFETNLFAAVRLDRAFLPKMLEQNSGVIIHISSIERILPLYDATLAYAAAKAALTNYSKGLSNEVAPKGVRVNTVAPGFIESEMTTQLPAKLQDEFLHSIPLGRLGTCEEVAELVAFLAGPGAGYITGQVVNVNGGLYM